MYIRFICDRPHPTVAARAGIFFAYWRLLDHHKDEDFRVRHRGRPGNASRVQRRRRLSLNDAAEAVEHLPAPKMRGPERVRHARKALFWFRETAGWDRSAPGTVILDVRWFAAELSRWGVQIDEICRPDPGRIIWQDRFQVLAIPQAE